jgi:NAD(P)H-hydrate epimerase
MTAKHPGQPAADVPLDDSPMPRLAERPAESHKGHFGLALVIGGSRGMAGAAAMAGMAALRGGAGLVRLGVPEVVQDLVASFEPSYMVSGLPSDPAGRIFATAREKIDELSAAATVVALGPGMGRSPQLDALAASLYTELSLPMVVDADGLNALAARSDVLARPGGPRVLTPHPGEFARLWGSRVEADDRPAAAIALADRCGVVLVLKGHRTLVTDGAKKAVNTTGNPGMATGGTGDVLTGLIAALVAQGMTPYDAARLGVHVHGLAGDLAAEDLGQVAMIASDLIRYLPQALGQFAAGQR